MGMRMVALLCFALAGWLVFPGLTGKRKAVDAEPVAAVGATGAMVPIRESRDSDVSARRTGRKEFEAERKRGLSEREVRWIVEDLQAAGFTSEGVGAETTEEYFALRKSRERWYLDTLAMGLGLTGEQKFQAAETLRELGNAEYEEFRKYAGSLKIFEVEGRPMAIVSGDKVGRFTLVGRWMDSSEYHPQNLCKLGEEQLEVSRSSEDREGYSTRDFGTDVRYTDLVDPFGDQYIEIADAGKIFPLSMAQVDGIRAARGKDFLAEVRYLTRSQLMTLLLFNPSVAKKISERLKD